MPVTVAVRSVAAGVHHPEHQDGEQQNPRAQHQQQVGCHTGTAHHTGAKGSVRSSSQPGKRLHAASLE
jgi:hypothetical protein